MNAIPIWGGRAWRRLLTEALQFIGTDISGLRVLEIGFRDGHISRHFARLGAEVIGVETHEESVINAAPAAGVTFIHYTGNLDEIHGTFDLIFTKSVLVLTDLGIMLPAIDRKLRQGGRVVFIENGSGGWIMKLARRIMHPRWNYDHVRYFSGAEIEQIRLLFDVQIVYSAVPPIYLIVGTSRTHAARLDMAFHVPGVPAVVQTAPGAPPAAGAVYQTLSPTAHVSVLGAAESRAVTFIPSDS